MSKNMRHNKLRIGEWVEVRSKEEILATLDAKGCIENMPFMPEMFQFCGRRFQVSKIAHKTCDYSTPYFHTRRLKGTVHLETRCDGEAHDGCQAGCLLFWKEDWLKPVSGDSTAPLARPVQIQTTTNGNGNHSATCSEVSLRGLVKINLANEEAPTYFCQMTEVPRATTDLHWWDIRQYVDDYRSGNVPFSRMVTGLIYSAYYHLSIAGIKVGRPMRWLYDHVNPLLGGSRFPRTMGKIPDDQPTPIEKLNLQPGELVRVKSHEQILETITTNMMNRGMSWDAELVPYCGGTYRVLRRVNKLIGEQSSKMVVMKSACIILDKVVCQARYSSCRMLCPKAMYPYWREIWLERVFPNTADTSSSPNTDAVTSHANTD
jgi:hypothetical protein